MVLTAGIVTPSFGVVIAALGGLLAVAGGWLLKYTIIDRGGFKTDVVIPQIPTQAAA